MYDVTAGDSYDVDLIKSFILDPKLLFLLC